MSDARTYVLYIIQKFVSYMFSGDVKLFSVSPGLIIIAASVLSVMVASTLNYLKHPVRVGSAAPRKPFTPAPRVIHIHNVSYGNRRGR